jgi:Flp pilus assembly pilin Flp
MKKFVMSLLKDESGTAVTEWVVAASIMAMAGIATFAAIGEDVSSILGVISSEVNTLETSVTAS